MLMKRGKGVGRSDIVRRPENNTGIDTVKYGGASTYAAKLEPKNALPFNSKIEEQAIDH